MYVGGAGGYSFYVRGGEQVIRQRRNNSNYGDTASRTRAQMVRRIRWGNLVNVFKSQKSWQPKAYDSKSKGQTDYNIFMALNINQATVGFTKEMCEAGCAVIEGYQVSRGSLPPIALSASQSGNYYVTDIKLTLTISGTTTVGQLAADIIANNPQFVEGDNIALVGFKNWLTSRTEFPYASSRYAEITLDSTSTTLLSTIPEFGSRLSKDTSGYLQVSWSSTGQYDPTREVGFVAIHTRKSASMLAVSSQEILMNSNSLVSSFSGSAWDEQCILSYGLTDEVPLGPSFKGAVIQSVTANGSEVTNLYGHVIPLSEPTILLVNGENFSGSNIWLSQNGTRLVPLDTGDGNTWTYILSADGHYTLYVNGSAYGSFLLDGAELPENLPTKVLMRQAPTAASPADDCINSSSLEEAVYLNFPYESSEQYPVFQLFLGSASHPFSDQDDFEFFGCTGEISAFGASTVKVALEASGSPAYVTYKSVIIAVFNYS